MKAGCLADILNVNVSDRRLVEHEDSLEDNEKQNMQDSKVTYCYSMFENIFLNFNTNSYWITRASFYQKP